MAILAVLCNYRSLPPTLFHRVIDLYCEILTISETNQVIDRPISCLIGKYSDKISPVNLDLLISFILSRSEPSLNFFAEQVIKNGGCFNVLLNYLNSKPTRVYWSTSLENFLCRIFSKNDLSISDVDTVKKFVLNLIVNTKFCFESLIGCIISNSPELIDVGIPCFFFFVL